MDILPLGSTTLHQTSPARSDLNSQQAISAAMPNSMIGWHRFRQVIRILCTAIFDTQRPQAVGDIFEDPICGNGICEAPTEYPGLGRFGCIPDCGLYPQRTSLRIDVQSAWAAGLPGLDFTGFNLSNTGEPAVQFTYNIYSETMGGYLLAEDSEDASLTLDVPDGNLRLDLFQVGSVSPSTPAGRLAAYAGVAPGTMPAAQKRFDFQYGDAAEAIAATAEVNRRLQDFCVSGAGKERCGAAYDASTAAASLRNMYGLAGGVWAVLGQKRRALLTFPFCALAPSADAAATLAGDVRELGEVNPALCGSDGGGMACYNGTLLARRFVCPASFSFSVWEFGPPRNVTLRPEAAAGPRMLTPFNNVVGAIIMTQYTRRPVPCSHATKASIGILTGRFSCQESVRSDVPFGQDPVFIKSSPLYNGKLAVRDYYTDTELAAGATRGPPGFFPHQWGAGRAGSSGMLSSENVGRYKLFFDTRMSASGASRLVQFMRDGQFLDRNTEWIEVEIVTYNADFNLFGILTLQFVWNLGGSILWSYQYNNALLSPYEGMKGTLSLCFDAAFGLMLLVDMLRAARDIYITFLRDDLCYGYISRFWNWVEWLHFSLLICGFAYWTSYNQFVDSIEFKAEYPVLKDLTAQARLFETDPDSEFNLLDFTIKMRKLSELKNFWTALSCVNTLLFVLRFLKVLDFQPRMSLITQTLRLASVDLGHYLTLFSIILIGYATIGTILLGDRLRQFQSFGSSAASLFMLLMAWEPQSMYLTMSSVTNQSKISATMMTFQVFFWTWVIIATFLMLNIVLAIIVESFSHIKAHLKKAPTITTESLSVFRQGLRILGNRLFGSEWLISDQELEKVLIKHDRSLQARKNLNLMRTLGKVRLASKSKCVRIPGGMHVSERDLETLLHEQKGMHKKSAMEMIRSIFKRGRQQPRARRQSRRFSLTSAVTDEDGIDIAVDGAYIPALPITDLINRYGEVVIEGQDDHELLEMLQTENIKREMALFATQDEIKKQVESIGRTLDSIAMSVLPEERIVEMRKSSCIRHESRTKSKDGCENVKGTFQGRLQVTVVSAKRLPKLDLFSESDPYCVLLIEENLGKGVHHGSKQTVLATTDTRMNDKNPIWNSAHQFTVHCALDSLLLVAVMDRDEVGSDDMIGISRIRLSDLPISKEVDQWYRLRNDNSPNLTKRALLRLKILLTPSTESVSPCGKQPKDTPRDLRNEPPWKKSWSAADADAMCGILDVTLVRVEHIPRAGRRFAKLSVCDPYVKISSGGTEFLSLVRKNTQNPEWGQSFAFVVPNLQNMDPVQLVIMDWNRYSQHEVIGNLEITAEHMIQFLAHSTYADSQLEHSFPIHNSKSRQGPLSGENLMHITLSFKWRAAYIHSQDDRLADSSCPSHLIQLPAGNSEWGEEDSVNCNILYDNDDRCDLRIVESSPPGCNPHSESFSSRFEISKTAEQENFVPLQQYPKGNKESLSV